MTQETYTAPPHGWTCFFCGETLKTWGAARDHFGADPLADAGCRIKAGAERGLLMALRKAEEQIFKYQVEDTALHRTMHDMQSRHADALQSAEELGFERGVAQARKERETT